jgi:hypothetical protein
VFYEVWDVAVDDAGNIYILDAGNQRLLIFDREGGYVQTIGRRGEGPGEFQRPLSVFLDRDRNICVMGYRVLHCFDPAGVFIERLTLPIFNHDVLADSRDRIVLVGRVVTAGGWDLGVVTLDAAGEITGRVRLFPGFRDLGGGLTIMHDYSPHVRIADLAERGIVFAHCYDYRLYRAGWSGEIDLIITREGAGERISRAEIDRIVTDFGERTRLGWTRSDIEVAADLPDRRPCIRDLLADDLGRIYVRRLKSVLDESTAETYEIFGPEGYYLYSLTLPFAPAVIREGCCYEVRTSDETGEIRVIRHLIENWNRIETGPGADRARR